MSPGPRPTALRSAVLISRCVWPQQTWAENWGTVLFWGGGAGSPSNTMWLGPRPTSIPSFILIHPAVWPQRTSAENWGLCPLLCGRGAGSSSNTMWPGPGPTSMPSFILIHPTVSPQYTNVTERTDRQDRQEKASQRSNSIGRTVLQTVAQKPWFIAIITCMEYKTTVATYMIYHDARTLIYIKERIM